MKKNEAYETLGLTQTATEEDIKKAFIKVGIGSEKRSRIISDKEKKITAITGKDIDIQADSVCVHGDGAKALAFVEKIREAFVKEGIQIRSLDEFVK